MLARDKIQRGFEMRSKNQKTKSGIEIKEKDLVLLKIPKQSDAIKRVTRNFFHLYFGPYIVTRDLGNNSFELRRIDNPEIKIGVHNQVN